MKSCLRSILPPYKLVNKPFYERQGGQKRLRQSRLLCDPISHADKKEPHNREDGLGEKLIESENGRQSRLSQFEKSPE